MREQVYVKFAEAIQQRQLEKQAAALDAAIHEQEVKIAEIDQQIEQLQMAKQASVSQGAGLQKMGEFDGAINSLLLTKQAELEKLAKLKAHKAFYRGAIRKGKGVARQVLGGKEFAKVNKPETGFGKSILNMKEVAVGAPNAQEILANLKDYTPMITVSKMPVDRAFEVAGAQGALGKPGVSFGKRVARARKGGTSLRGSATGSPRREARLQNADAIGSGEVGKKNGYLGKILAALGITGTAGGALYGLSRGGGAAAPTAAPLPPPPPGISNAALAALIGGGALAAGGVGAGAYAMSGDDEEKDKK